MAQVVWNKQAQQEWHSKLLYGFNEFGETTAVEFVRRTNHIIDNLKEHPQIGFIEPLLRHKKRRYRAYLLLGPLKMIYRYIESTDTIRIVDIWDMRREPKRLSRRIR